ncbi:PREDICTED: CD63 antigen-like [Ceratosolen solmsi marchali]|uniref:Tetraspanin n=1 Tax=Ceratosolen solmsi marchali TaxID=326594 RepID=A0AAJ7E0L2_9HYME|nr:PREDICTED: CD63 antigen-like [Ceratosolen solmsi marchali]
MNCGMECIKYLLFIFNFIFALSGLAILICGVIIHMSMDYVIKANIEVPISSPAIVLIIIGAVIFIIAFFGCCGAIRESHCMVITFAILLLTLLIIKVSVASYIFIQNGNKIEEKIFKDLEKSIKQYFNSNEAIRTKVDSIQFVFQCCGYNSYNDYLNDQKNTQGIIPGSCCNKQENQFCHTSEASKVEGCGKILYSFIIYYGSALCGLALGIAVIELIGIIFSFCLANSIRNVERRGYKV